MAEGGGQMAPQIMELELVKTVRLNYSLSLRSKSSILLVLLFF